jgi:cell division protein FtsI (penicillin-binding protein 3)
MATMPRFPDAEPTDSSMVRGHARLRIVAVGFAIAFGSIGLRLIDMVDWDRSGAPAQALLSPAADQGVLVDEDAERAEIVDRNGVVLATNIRVPGVHADPSLLADKAKAARQLAAILPGVDAAELQARLEAGRRFAWVKHRITPEEQRAVLELGLPGVAFSMADQRVYPKERLTSHVTGFVDVDNRGRAGIERYFDDRLRQGGEPVALSLDMRIQQIVRDELSDAYHRYQAIGANAMVLDRVTGELLAMVSLPDFDPNRVGDVRRIEYLNRNTGEVYELGSVFKVLTLAAALDSGQVTLHDKFDATGKLQIGRFRIGDDHAKNRWLSVPEIFEYSSNIGTARIAFAAGGGPLLEGFFRRVGLYAPPDIEITEAVRSRTPKRWPDVTVATTAFGHGIAVTPLQFIDAAGGLVGDGTRVPTTLVKRSATTELPRTRYVDPHTADLMHWLMWLVVEQGSGTRAKLDSYLIGGKTGTAEKSNGRGYSKDKVLASFLAAFPIDAPRYVVLVSFDEPKGDASTHGLRYGGWTAGPVAAAIIDRIGPVLGVPPTPPEVAQNMRARLAALQPAGPMPSSLQEASFAPGSARR